MSKRYRPSRRELGRCAACGEHWPEISMRLVWRDVEPTTLLMCQECWWDALRTVNSGAAEWNSLLDAIAALALGGVPARQGAPAPATPHRKNVPEARIR